MREDILTEIGWMSSGVIRRVEDTDFPSRWKVTARGKDLVGITTRDRLMSSLTSSQMRPALADDTYLGSSLFVLTLRH